jgi:hypothetical protein
VLHLSTAEKKKKLIKMMRTMMIPRDIPLNESITFNSDNRFGSDDDRATPNPTSTSMAVRPPARVSTLLNRIPSGRRMRTELPADFKPCPYSVVLGRGKVNDYIGNRRLKVFASMNLHDYVAAKSRREKSYVVARVMETVQKCCGGLGAFIRLENGVWYEVEDSMAREKIGVVFRDLSPAGQYKSSTKNKVERRRQRKEERSKQRASASSFSSSSSSSTTSSAASEDDNEYQQQQGQHTDVDEPLLSQQQQQQLKSASRFNDDGSISMNKRLPIINFDFSSTQHIITTSGDVQNTHSSNNNNHHNHNDSGNDDNVSLSDNSLAAYN